MLFRCNIATFLIQKILQMGINIIFTKLGVIFTLHYQQNDVPHLKIKPMKTDLNNLIRT